MTGKKCFRCGAPAPTYVEYFPPDVFRRFPTCWTCSDALAVMPDQQRRAEFEREIKR